MATMADRIKLPDLINKWMEVQKTRAGLDEENPLKVDAIELTLLLKSMGFKLEYLDFNHEKSSSNTLKVDIKCKRSGVLAVLTYDLVDCTCPSTDEKDVSFWEVQATGPKEFSKFKNNTSSNLLPEVSENCSIVSKAMLSNLLDYYRSSIKIIEQGEDVLQTPLKVATPKIAITSPGDTIRTPFATPPAEGKSISVLEPAGASANKYTVNVTWSPRKPKSLDNSFEIPKQLSGSKMERKLNRSAYDIDIDNILKDDVVTENVKVPSSELIPSETPINGTPDDISFANSEAMKAFITSSPNEKEFASVLNLDQNHERDLNIIHCMQQARQKIDAALLVMRLNNPCNNIPHESAIMTTPQTTVRKQSQSESSEAERKMSLTGSAILSNGLFECGLCGARKAYTEVTELRKSALNTKLASSKTSASSSEQIDSKPPSSTQSTSSKSSTNSQQTTGKTSSSTVTSKSFSTSSKTSTQSKFRSTAATQVLVNKSLSARKDTPRPAGLQPKPVAVLRKIASVTSVSSVTSAARTTSSTLSITKKTTTGIKPTTNLRTRRSVGDPCSPMMNR